MGQYVRRVHFFHITIYDKDGNLFLSKPDKDGHDEFSKVCYDVQKLSSSEKTFKVGGDEPYRLIYFEEKSGVFWGKVAKYRNSHMLTGSVSDDTLSDLALDDGNEFVEVTHFVYSPTKHILSFEYNQLGPRISAFMRYLNIVRSNQSVDASHFASELIPHPDIIERLKDVSRVKSFTIALSADRIPDSINQGNLLRGMKYIRGFSNAGMITIQLSQGQ